MKRNDKSSYPSFFEDLRANGFLDWVASAGIGNTSETSTLPRVNIIETGTD